MSSTKYNNIPPERNTSSSDQTVLVFDQYYSNPIELNNNELIAMTGFFETRGFGKSSAESTAIAMLKQAKFDGYSAMYLMDTLKGLSSVELSSLVGEILNYNRYKTSVLGASAPTIHVGEPYRNVFNEIPALPAIPLVDGDELVTGVYDTVLTGNLLDNASDDPAYTYSVSTFIIGSGSPVSAGSGNVTIGGGVGTINIQTNGAWTFTPTTGYYGAIPVITYTVVDTGGRSDDSTLTITAIAIPWYFLDTFTEDPELIGEGLMINQHTADTGEGWLNDRAQTAYIDWTGTQLFIGSEGSGGIYTTPINIPTADYYVSMKVNTLTQTDTGYSGYVAIFIRNTSYDGYNNRDGYILKVFYASGTNTFSAQIVQGGLDFSGDNLLATSVDIPASASNEFTIAASGLEITSYYNGVLLNAVTDGTWTAAGTKMVVEASSESSGTIGAELDYVKAYPGLPPMVPVADFDGIPTSGVVPLTVAFTDFSIGTNTSWLWNFGDGNTSTVQNPTHVYSVAGTYTVSLTDQSGTATKTNYITALAVETPTTGVIYTRAFSVNNTLNATQNTLDVALMLTAGQVLKAGTTNIVGASSFDDTYIRLLDNAGSTVAFSDDIPGISAQSYFEYTVPTTGVYILKIGGFDTGSATGTAAWQVI